MQNQRLKNPIDYPIGTPGYGPIRSLSLCWKISETLRGFLLSRPVYPFGAGAEEAAPCSKVDRSKCKTIRNPEVDEPESNNQRHGDQSNL